jgi:penicillin-insensitive murein endopeptidase
MAYRQDKFDRRTVVRMLRLITAILLIVGCTSSSAEESVCYGTTNNGRLVNGAKLPSGGANYESYSPVGKTLGRTFVHSKVKKAIVDTYRKLQTVAPDKVYKYGETGKKEGGPFWPHKTHQNGLSADFFVPVIDETGASVHLPTNAFNKWGYNIEFDKFGVYDGYKLDFDAMAAHLIVLHKTAKADGIEIWRVIFDPKLQKYLFKTKHGRYLKRHMNFSKKKSWVRHDEHYHVDFVVECKKSR